MTITADELAPGNRRSNAEQAMFWVFITLPIVALVLAVPMAWGWGVGWLDIALLIFFYVFSCLGVTIGYHRHFTHSAFKAPTWFRVTLAIIGSLAVQGSILHWVSYHRRHHAYSDKEGDPHSPWLFGTGFLALAKGFWHSHMGWMFVRDELNAKRYAPDLLADREIMRVSRNFPWLVAVSLALPALIGGLVTWSWWGMFTGFFWGGLVRIALLHQITWSINSVCHMVGVQPFRSRDQSRNFWPLAILSMGEAWHNLHHADPTCARHGVLKGQPDISARLIWLFEKFGWVHDVRWPTPRRLAKITNRATSAG